MKEEDDIDGDEVDADHGVLQLELAEDQVEEFSADQELSCSKTSYRFHLDKRTKNVQGLLEKMFEHELKPEEEGLI